MQKAGQVPPCRARGSREMVAAARMGVDTCVHSCVKPRPMLDGGANLPVLEERHLSSARQTTNGIDTLLHVALGEQLRPRVERGRSRAGARRPHSPHSPPSLPAADSPRERSTPLLWSSASLHLAF